MSRFSRYFCAVQSLASRGLMAGSGAAEPGSLGALHSLSTAVRASASHSSAASPSLPHPSASLRGVAASGAAGLHSSSSAQAVEVAVPAMGESITEGAISTILVSEGAYVKENDIVAQIETDKVTIDVRYTNSQGGKVTKVLVRAGDTVRVGQLVIEVEPGDAPAGAATPPAAKAAPAPAKAAEAPKKEAPKAAPKQEIPASAPTASPVPPPSAPGAPLERRVKMTRLRMRVAERLKGAQNTYAMLTTFNEIDMSGLMSLRNQYKDEFLEKHGVKLGFMSAFVKASADALKLVPAVNAVIDGDEIVYRDYTDISVAVATPKGLVVPVLRRVDSLSFADIEKNINALGKKARDGTISIDDMAGGTFTISNGGVYGSMLSTPIINPPQSAVLGMHNIQERAVVVNGKIEARPMMYVALTYDHRLIDGREAVTFLRRVKDVVEDPRRLLI